MLLCEVEGFYLKVGELMDATAHSTSLIYPSSEIVSEETQQVTSHGQRVRLSVTLYSHRSVNVSLCLSMTGWCLCFKQSLWL